MAVLLKNLPPHTQEGQIRRAMAAFGAVVEVQVFFQTSQALVRMQYPADAQRILAQGYVTLDNGAVLQVVPAGSGGHHQMQPPPQPQQQQMAMAPPPQQLYGGQFQPQGAMPQLSYRINVVIEDCKYPMNTEVLSKVFAMAAPPTQVQCLQSGQITSGFVMYSDMHAAMAAMSRLNGQHIYPDSCKMMLTLEQPQQTFMPMAPPTQQPPPPHGGFQPHGYHQHHHHQHHMHHHHHHGHHHHNAGFTPIQPQQQAADVCVVIVSGVPENVPLQPLWVLLETFGNVLTLKRQFSSKTNVIAKFQNASDSRTVMPIIQQTPFFGGTISAKHFAGYVDRAAFRTEWNLGPPTDAATAAYNFASEHHRTKPSATFSPGLRPRPDCNLFVTNLSESVSDDEVKELFTSRGFVVEDFYRKMPLCAMVKLPSVAAGVEALCTIHALRVGERFLKVSFSRFPPGPPPERFGAGKGSSGDAGNGEVAVVEEAPPVPQSE